jgi:hypothetical protein
MRATPLALPLLVLLALAGACRNAPGPGEVRAAEAAARARLGPPPVVHGTVLDARTRRPVAGARVRVPGGLEVVSDVEGRFVLAGLELGWEGDLEAVTDSGQEGRNRLRALGPGDLEVVVFVR